MTGKQRLVLGFILIAVGCTIGFLNGFFNNNHYAERGCTVSMWEVMPHVAITLFAVLLLLVGVYYIFSCLCFNYK